MMKRKKNPPCGSKEYSSGILFICGFKMNVANKMLAVQSSLINDVLCHFRFILGANLPALKSGEGYRY